MDDFLNKLSDKELQAIADNKLENLSDETLNFIANKDSGVGSAVNQSETAQTNPLNVKNAFEDFISGGGLTTTAARSVNPNIPSSRESLPFTNQLLLSSIPRAVNPLAPTPVTAGLGVAGATIGEAEKQFLNHLEGQKFNPGDIAGTAAATTAIETLLGVGGHLLFRNPIAAGLIKKYGTQLGKLKDVISTASDTDPNVSVPKQPIVDAIDEALTKVKGARGKAAGVLRKWKAILTDASHPEHIAGDSILGRDIIRIENDLNNGLSYKSFRVGPFEIKVPPADPDINNAGKAVRTQVSNSVDNLASRMGGPASAFADISEKIYSLKKSFPDSEIKKTLLNSLVKESVLGGAGFAASKATGNDNVGKALFFGGNLLSVPAVRDALFKYLYQTGASRLAAVGSSELARKAVNS